jgi:hypothetical protein
MAKKKPTPKSQTPVKKQGGQLLAASAAMLLTDLRALILKPCQRDMIVATFNFPCKMAINKQEQSQSVLPFKEWWFASLELVSFSLQDVEVLFRGRIGTPARNKPLSVPKPRFIAPVQGCHRQTNHRP